MHPTFGRLDGKHNYSKGPSLSYKQFLLPILESAHESGAEWGDVFHPLPPLRQTPPNYGVSVNKHNFSCMRVVSFFDERRWSGISAFCHDTASGRSSAFISGASDCCYFCSYSCNPSFFPPSVPSPRFAPPRPAPPRSALRRSKCVCFCLPLYFSFFLLTFNPFSPNFPFLCFKILWENRLMNLIFQYSSN